MSKSKLDIRRAMTEHNISYATLSERTGIDKGNISKLFTGNPTLSKIEAIADAIGIDIREMFFPVEEQPAEEVFAPADAPTEEEQANEQQTVQTIAFCPHCGAKVRVGVVLLPE